MANLNPSVTSSSSNKSRRPASKVGISVPAEPDEASAAVAPLTHAQEEILGMLDGTWTAADDARVQEHPIQGLGVDVVLAAVGAAGIFAGMALLFFATAVGAVVLVLGCLTCTLAFEHALVADTKPAAAAEVHVAADVDEALDS